MKKNPNIAFAVLRFGLAFVLIWFACAQFGNPSKWISFLPSFVKALPLSAVTFVQINALFEIIAATLLILGAWVRVVAFLLTLHLLGIAITIGWNPTGIRDLGLAVAVCALFFGGAGTCSIDTGSHAPTLS